MAKLLLSTPVGLEFDALIEVVGDPRWKEIDKITHDETAAEGSDIQLLEECEYEYTLSTPAPVRSIEPSEIFSADSNRTHGRIKTRGRTGTVRVVIELENGEVATGEFEVRSRKLEYKTEYRWMLDRIASEAAELALSPFAASQLSSLADDHSASPETLYQRFEFLRSRLESDEVQSAIEQLRNRPHMAFEEQVEIVSTTRPMRGGAALARQLTRTGPRQPLQRNIGVLDSVPLEIERRSHFESLDTIPNRFVKYVVQDWHALVSAVAETLENATDRSVLPSLERGRRETRSILDTLEDLQRMPALRDASDLDEFPASNTVVRGRAGYREFLAAFQTTNAHAHLRWDEDEDSRSAGQHDVPTLYEYWVFLEIVRIVETLDGFTANREDLVVVSNNQMSLDLKKSKQVRVACTGERNGQKVELGLWFNRTFSNQKNESWTVRLIPDVSISMTVPGRGEEPEQTTWLHFDAKYKVNLAFDRSSDDVDEADLVGTVKQEDLHKMHAYRDAIRRSAGAYVVYPGTDDEPPFNQYHELLPGLGAFCLRPSDGGEADSASSGNLTNFLTDVIDHLTFDGTNFDRDRFWTETSHQNESAPSKKRPFVNRPPADTQVLLGFVRSNEHEAAIRELRMYNLRSDAGRKGAIGVQSESLGAELIVLYKENGAATVARTNGSVSLRRKSELEVLNYDPSGEIYLCLGIEEFELLELDGDAIRNLAESAVPISLTWADVEKSLDGT